MKRRKFGANSVPTVCHGGHLGLDTSRGGVSNPPPLLSAGYCYKPLFSVGRSVGALSLGNKSMADLIGILGSKSSVAQNRIPSQRLLLRLTTEELS